MASGATSESTPQETPRGQRFVEYEQFIDDCVRRTRGHLRWRDLAGSALALAISLFAILFVAAVLDHWFIPGGLGPIGRLLFFVLLVGAASYFLVRHVLPTLTRRINPVYAANTIEHSTPGLKNTLLNFLMFRRDRTPVPSAVYEAIEEQAAVRLSDVPVDSAVDRSNLVRLAVLLAGTIIVLAIYTAASPKNPWQSVARVLMPLSDLQVPSRVVILDVEPAERYVNVPRGNQLVISANVQGVDENDPVTVFYSTADARHVDQPLPMHVAPGDYRYGCRLPESSSGVQQDMTFRIEAGDAVTPTYRVRVTAAPTIAVDSIHYEYPAYTGQSSRRVADKGDIRAIEGTRITLRAKANAEIQSAYIDFDCDGRSERAMQVGEDGDQTTAQASFTLALSDDGQTPEHASYQLWFTNSAGHKNRQPVQYAIDVIADEPPQIELVAPAQREVTLPLNGQLDIRAVASDPDFALAKVDLQALADDRSLFEKVLLKGQRRGKFEGKLTFVPQQYELKPGDVVTYWATAEDNKAPDANGAETERRRILIVAPDRRADKDRDRMDPNNQPASDKQPESDEDTNDDSESTDDAEGESGDSSGDSSEGGGPGEGKPTESGEAGESDGTAGQGKSDDASESSEPGEEGSSGSAQREPGEGKSGDMSTDGGDASQENGERQEEGERSDGASGGSGADRQHGEPGDMQEPDGSGKPSADKQRQPASDDQSGGDTDSEPVPSDGSDDGSAFEKMRDHLQQQSQEDSPQSNENETGKAQQDSSADGEAADRQRTADPGERPDGDLKDQEASGSEEPRDAKKDPTAQQPSSDAAADEQEKPRDKSDDGESSGTDKSSQGDAGAGQPDRDEQRQGTPDRQNDMRPDDKQPGENANRPPSDDTQPPTSAHGNKESDSQSDQGGDKSGGGEKGGGQRSNQDGKGDAGQNQPDDKGTGKADQQGDGETGDKAGDGPEADSETGKSGDKPGQGGKQRSKSDGNGQETQQPMDPNQGDNRSKSGDPSGEKPTGDPQSGQPGQGDPRGDSARSKQPAAGTEPGDSDDSAVDKAEEVADEANLEYARQVTDLVLERLEDQAKRDQVDPKLLEKLGWNKEDMKRFLARWQKMKSDAQRKDQGGDEARRELDDTLRSLGLRKDRLRRGAQSKSDAQRGLRQSQRRATPAELREQLETYLRRTSRGD